MTDRILLVGATGFLGSFVAARLMERHPVALVRPSSETSVLPRGMELRRGSLNGGPLPLDGISTVVYCASMGFGHVPRSVRQLEQRRISRALFISTTAVFTTLPSASRTPRLEAEAAVERSSMDWTILRPTMIYGTARDRNISRLLRFLKRIPVFPLCGNALWQPIYVEDLADAVVAALDSSDTVKKVYNVAGAQPLRFADLVRTAGRAVERNVTLIRVPLAAAVLAAGLTRVVTPEQICRLAEDKAFSYADAARDFLFAPRSFAEGVACEAEALGLARRAPPRVEPRR
ncbi:MAG: NAD-dependent epimerase/dehydratase family protein [Chloroflexi bacterium]|nr:MAG: NAD-dependent epimerase/dehydratase family protein [Chloroflexota bacterium]